MAMRYEHLDTFFKPTSWAEDIKGSFALKQNEIAGWNAFAQRIQELNDNAKSRERVIVIYAARHGEGEHNVLGEKYGMHPDDANVKYPILDPQLTQLGREQAAELRIALQREIANGMPEPTKWFVSPLRRCGQTLGIEWGWKFGGNEKDEGEGVPGSILENLREHIMLHQCNSRRPVSDIRTSFPTFSIPDDMEEQDVMFEKQTKIGSDETEVEVVQRCGRGISEAIEQSDGATYISLTAHNGALRGVYAALGVPARSLDIASHQACILTPLGTRWDLQDRSILYSLLWTSFVLRIAVFQFAPYGHHYYTVTALKQYDSSRLRMSYTELVYPTDRSGFPPTSCEEQNVWHRIPPVYCYGKDCNNPPGEKAQSDWRSPDGEDPIEVDPYELRYDVEVLPFFEGDTPWSERKQGGLGLVLSDDTVSSREAFAGTIEDLRRQCTENEKIVVLYLGRHGEGDHNTTKERWPTLAEVGLHQAAEPHLDASLNKKGEGQISALTDTLRSVVRSQSSTEGWLPRPEKIFVSPAVRTLQTMTRRWKDIVDLSTIKPESRMTLREIMFTNVCDALKPISSKEEEYPYVNFSDVKRYLTESGHDTLHRCHICRSSLMAPDKLNVPVGQNAKRTKRQLERFKEILRETIEERERVIYAIESIFDTMTETGKTYAAVEGHSQWLKEAYDSTFDPVINPDGSRRPSEFTKLTQGEMRPIVCKIKRRSNTTTSDSASKGSADRKSLCASWYKSEKTLVPRILKRWARDETEEEP